jgi:hypothetical protein
VNRLKLTLTDGRAFDFDPWTTILFGKRLDPGAVQFGVDEIASVSLEDDGQPNPYVPADYVPVELVEHEFDQNIYAADGTLVSERPPLKVRVRADDPVLKPKQKARG